MTKKLNCFLDLDLKKRPEKEISRVDREGRRNRNSSKKIEKLE